MIDTLFFAGISLILLLLLLCVFKGPTLWDRILAANLCSSVTAMGILLVAVVTENVFYVDAALVFVLVGFIGTQFYSVFISRFGRL